jgi:hypothetical protein
VTASARQRTEPTPAPRATIRSRRRPPHRSSGSR